MTVKMILAVDRGNAIGWADGRLPWKIPADMKRFKELTSGTDVLMGRKTFESLGRPDGLPNRKNIVISRNPVQIPSGPCGLDNMNDLGAFVRAHQADGGVLWIIGGATIYDQAIELQLVDEIHMTLVDDNSGADITLQNDLVNWKMFVLHQAKIGVQWNLEYMSAPGKTDTGLSYTFITLKKSK